MANCILYNTMDRYILRLLLISILHLHQSLTPNYSSLPDMPEGYNFAEFCLPSQYSM